MRKIGGHVSTAGGVVNAITNTESIGGNCMQIFAGSPRMWARKLYTNEAVVQFNQLVDERNLRPVFIHSLYLINLGSDNPELVEKSRQSLIMDLKNGELIKSAGVVVHLGSHQGRGFESVKDQIVSEIKQILNETKETPFLIENTAMSAGKIGGLEEIGELLAAINDPRLQVCLDTAHLYESGWDISKQETVNSLVTKLKELKILPKVRLIHLNDSKTKLDSRHDVHANLGEGEIGQQGLKNFINHPVLANLPLLLEVPGADKMGPDAVNIQIAKSLSEG